MKQIMSLGIDISKNVFELCGLDKQGNKIYKKTVKREDFVRVVQKLLIKTAYMEACGGANHWQRTLKQLAVEVKLISPQFVKPYVKTNKTDSNDAEAIAEAGSRGPMRYVSEKSLEPQDIQSLLRIRERLKNNRTRLINETRGLLGEYGIAIPKGANRIYKYLPEIIENEEGKLTVIMKRPLNQLFCELRNIDQGMVYYEKELSSLYNSHQDAKKLSAIPGIGMLTALAVIALVGHGKQFLNARHFAAYLGLVPRQHSSGGHEKLLGISKRGNILVRTLLIHGARAVVAHVEKKADSRSQWIKELKERRGFNRATVALANKNARIIWALLAKETQFSSEHYYGSGTTNAPARAELYLSVVGAC